MENAEIQSPSYVFLLRQLEQDGETLFRDSTRSHAGHARAYVCVAGPVNS